MITLTENVLKVLVGLFGGSADYANFSSIAKATGLSVMGVLKIAKKLELSGLVKIAKIGKSSVVRLNAAQENIEVFSIAEKYRFEKFMETHPELKAFLLLAREKVKADSMLVFGSYASDEAGEESDLDLLLVNPRPDAGKTIGELSSSLLPAAAGKQVAPVYVSRRDFIKQLSAGHNRLYREIAQGNKRVLIKGESYFWKMLLEVPHLWH